MPCASRRGRTRRSPTTSSRASGAHAFPRSRVAGVGAAGALAQRVCRVRSRARGRRRRRRGKATSSGNFVLGRRGRRERGEVLGVIPDQAFTIGDYILDPTPIESGAFGTVYSARRRADGRARRAEARAVDRGAGQRRQARGRAPRRRTAAAVRALARHGARGIRVRRAPQGTSTSRWSSSKAARSRTSSPPGPWRRRWRPGTPLCICEFLDKAHQFLTIEGEPGNAIVHADLKPQHILLPRPGEIRVLDFGIAKALAKTRPGHHEHLGHDLLRISGAARVGWREPVRRLLVTRA